MVGVSVYDIVKYGLGGFMKNFVFEFGWYGISVVSVVLGEIVILMIG